MKIRLVNRTLEIGNRVNVNSFKKEKTLIGTSLRKSDLKQFKHLRKLFLFCFMPYKWLDKKFCEGKL